MMHWRIPVLLLAILLIGGCAGGDFSDLDAYMAETRATPRGSIDPIPTFKPYKAFTYAAQADRPPFDKPVEIVLDDSPGGPEVKPDLNRSKEFLEGFSIEGLNMVGTLDQAGQRWALIDDGSGGVHRVQAGNYVGQDHGRIEEISPSWIRVMEITSNGVGGWARRPRMIELSERN